MMKKFDAFEVEPCREMEVGDGVQTFVETMQRAEITDKNQPDFWGVYGHIPNAGVECLADCPDEETANAISQALTSVHLCKKRVATELLEALEQLMSRLAEHGSIDLIREEGPIEDARQAISKAKGEQQ